MANFSENISLKRAISKLLLVRKYQKQQIKDLQKKLAIMKNQNSKFLLALNKNGVYPITICSCFKDDCGCYEDSINPINNKLLQEKEIEIEYLKNLLTKS
jgi:hypothetical protein